jgi:hypothetical protein
VGTDDATGGRLAPETDHPPSLAELASPSHTQGGSRMRESRTYDSVRGACGARAAGGDAGARVSWQRIAASCNAHSTSEVAPSVPIAAGPWKLLRPRKLIVLEPGLSRV